VDANPGECAGGEGHDHQRCPRHARRVVRRRPLYRLPGSGAGTASRGRRCWEHRWLMRVCGVPQATPLRDNNAPPVSESPLAPIEVRLVGGSMPPGTPIRRPSRWLRSAGGERSYAPHLGPTSPL
jgi:hypothetical protein